MRNEVGNFQPALLGKIQSALTRGEPVELHGGAVKVIDQLVVEAGVELQRAHETGYAEQFGAHGEACDGGGEPKEGAQAGERRAQPPDRVPPGHPQ